MATVWLSNTHSEEWDDDDPKIRAYKALYRVSEQIGKNNYAAGLYRGKRYSLTQEHIDITKAMPDVLAGKITPEEAMALVGSYGVLKQRFPPKPPVVGRRKRTIIP